MHEPEQFHLVQKSQVDLNLKLPKAKQRTRMNPISQCLTVCVRTLTRHIVFQNPACQAECRACCIMASVACNSLLFCCALWSFWSAVSSPAFCHSSAFCRSSMLSSLQSTDWLHFQIWHPMATWQYEQYCRRIAYKFAWALCLHTHDHWAACTEQTITLQFAMQPRLHQSNMICA